MKTLCACAALILSAGPVAAQDCRVALTLALDVSSSVDAAEYRLQMEGLASALEDPAVRRAIFQVPRMGVALQVFEWSGVYDQVVVTDWVLIDDPGDLDRLSTTLRSHTRSFSNAATGLGHALAFGLRQIGRAPACGYYKIDVSGDGQSNVGVPPQMLYTRQDFGETTVNGLAIESDEDALSRYYEYFVIRGPGAFVERAEDFEDYGRAMRAKLIRELGTPQLGMR